MLNLFITERRNLSFKSKYSSQIENLVYPQFCNECEVALKPKESLFCRLCLKSNLEKTNLGNWVGELKTSDYLDEALSLLWFSSMVQECIHHLKYHQFKIVVSNLFDVAFDNNCFDIENYSLIVPIPLHRVKFRERGFNQAEVIAQKISDNYNIPINTKLLKRTHYTNTQTKLNITERRANVHNAFRSEQNLSGNILLVDDVLTTGATSSACAQSLKYNGCKLIGVFTLATPIIDT